MPLIDINKREILCKIVYYGIPRCGKSTSLQYIYDKNKDNQRSELLHTHSDKDRVVFFSCIPSKQEMVRGFSIRFYLYTIPGFIQYNESLIGLLSGVDGITFVVDSQRKNIDENKKILDRLTKTIRANESLKANGRTIDDMPFVIQYNKRDMPDTLAVDQLDRYINLLSWPTFESIAIHGIGVLDTFDNICQQIINKIK